MAKIAAAALSISHCLNTHHVRRILSTRSTTVNTSPVATTYQCFNTAKTYLRRSLVVEIMSSTSGIIVQGESSSSILASPSRPWSMHQHDDRLRLPITTQQVPEVDLVATHPA